MVNKNILLAINTLSIIAISYMHVEREIGFFPTVLVICGATYNSFAAIKNEITNEFHSWAMYSASTIITLVGIWLYSKKGWDAYEVTGFILMISGATNILWRKQVHKLSERQSSALALNIPEIQLAISEMDIILGEIAPYNSYHLVKSFVIEGLQDRPENFIRIMRDYKTDVRTALCIEVFITSQTLLESKDFSICTKEHESTLNATGKELFDMWIAMSKRIVAAGLSTKEKMAAEADSLLVKL